MIFAADVKATAEGFGQRSARPPGATEGCGSFDGGDRAGGGDTGFVAHARAILSGLNVEALRRDAQRGGVEHQVMSDLEALQRLLS